MILSIISLFSHLVRAAFLPRTLRPADLALYGNWRENKKDSPSAWLPFCVRYIRYEE